MFDKFTVYVSGETLKRIMAINVIDIEDDHIFKMEIKRDHHSVLSYIKAIVKLLLAIWKFREGPENITYKFHQD